MSVMSAFPVDFPPRLAVWLEEGREDSRRVQNTVFSLAKSHFVTARVFTFWRTVLSADTWVHSWGELLPLPALCPRTCWDAVVLNLSRKLADIIEAHHFISISSLIVLSPSSLLCLQRRYHQNILRFTCIVFVYDCFAFLVLLFSFVYC